MRRTYDWIVIITFLLSCIVSLSTLSTAFAIISFISHLEPERWVKTYAQQQHEA